MSQVDVEWEKWGKNDPYFGVMSHNKFSSRNIAENKDEFFQSGEQTVQYVLDKYEQNFGKISRGDVLDFGCGVGRLSLAFARRFDNVTGIDISPSMLSEATRNMEKAGLSNCAFHLSDDDLTAADRQFDFVNTYIVIQHIPVARGMRIIDQLIRRVRPGGGFLIHFSVRNETGLRRLKHWVRSNVPLGEPVWNRLQGHAASVPAMQMNAYPMLSVLELLEKANIRETLMLTERHRRHYDRWTYREKAGRHAAFLILPPCTGPATRVV